MAMRNNFFDLLDGKRITDPLFFPDITDWYQGQRLAEGEPQQFIPGEFIPDNAPIHRFSGKMPQKYSVLTFSDFYNRFDWGLPIHLYRWYEELYEDGIEKTYNIDKNTRTISLVTPKGTLQRIEKLSPDGSWSVRKHFCEDIDDLEIVKEFVSGIRFIPKYEYIEQTLAAIGERGIGDVVISRSPFGKLVHEYIGFEEVIYALDDDEDAILEFLQFQEKKDLELVELAAAAPARLIIMSDHTDENLISPRQYADYCIPYYRKVCDIFHHAGKYVSTHLDGNIRNYFPLLKETGFDFLDGCTPAPMFNYEVEELAEALNGEIKTYCGIPSSLFCTVLPMEKILKFADRILNAFDGQVILNIGDILPLNGDIEQVIAVGEHIRKKSFNGA